MSETFLSTSEIARAVFVHPNTVRLYENWGFLPGIPRSPSGYRRFTESHLQQMQLARTALRGGWPGAELRESAVQLVRRSASGDLGGALELGYRHLALVQAERAQAESAALLLQRWAQGRPADATDQPLQTAETARFLGVSIDVLRNWERNGLIRIPRNPRNRYRLYGPVEIERLRVIRMLHKAGYSTMAILRMLIQLDQGRHTDLRQALDTPRPDEDVFSAADRWLSSLEELEGRALEMIRQLEEMIAGERKRR